MAHDEDWDARRPREDGFNEGDNVGEDEGGGACEPAVFGGVDGLAPAALVEAVGFYAVGCETGKEFIVAVYVVVEAVDED